MSAIEPAGVAFAASMAVIHASAFPAGERWGPDAIALQLSVPGACGFISAAGGFVLARMAADEAEILTLAVDPSIRRQGLGRQLLERALAEAAARGVVMMFLEVSELNVAARALYGSCGFAEVGRRRRYYGGRVDALVLRAAIPCGSKPG